MLFSGLLRNECYFQDYYIWDFYVILNSGFLHSGLLCSGRVRGTLDFPKRLRNDAQP
jgi:hypothetical protein